MKCYILSQIYIRKLNLSRYIWLLDASLRNLIVWNGKGFVFSQQTAPGYHLGRLLKAAHNEWKWFSFSFKNTSFMIGSFLVRILPKGRLSWPLCFREQARVLQGNIMPPSQAFLFFFFLSAISPVSLANVFSNVTQRFLLRRLSARKQELVASEERERR